MHDARHKQWYQGDIPTANPVNYENRQNLHTINILRKERIIQHVSPTDL